MHCPPRRAHALLLCLSPADGPGKLKLKLQPDVIELAYGCNHRLVAVCLSVRPLVAPIISLIAFAAICNHNKLLLVGAGKKHSMQSSSDPDRPMGRHTELAYGTGSSPFGLSFVNWVFKLACRVCDCVCYSSFVGVCMCFGHALLGFATCS